VDAAQLGQLLVGQRGVLRRAERVDRAPLRPQPRLHDHRAQLRLRGESLERGGVVGRHRTGDEGLVRLRETPAALAGRLTAAQCTPFARHSGSSFAAASPLLPRVAENRVGHDRFSRRSRAERRDTAARYDPAR
jgi:hypothetical protein